MNAPLYFGSHAKLIGYSPSLVACEEAAPGYGPSRDTSPDAIGDWRQVHARVVELGAERAGHERELCRWLLAAERLGVHTRAGYASLREYADRIVGLNGRQTEERLRVGRALAALPGLDEALATGELSWSVVRELSRVATAETERAWRAWAKGRRSRDVERAVASRHRGDVPEDRGDPTLVRHRLSFEVRAETMALFRDAQAAVRAQLGGDVGDDTFLYELARRALGGPSDEGRASYQVAVTRCDDCRRTSIDAGGRSHPIDEAIAEMAACDGQHLGRVGGFQARAHDFGVAPRRDGLHIGAPMGRGLHDHERAPGAGSHDHEATTGLSRHDHEAATGLNRHDHEAATYAGSHERDGTPGARPDGHEAAGPHMGAPAPKRSRATQTIPPAVRRAVIRRDRRRCVVPGCENHVFLDVHHLDPRAEGGGHDPERLAVTCGSHHRSVHLGHLRIEGTASGGFSVRHGDGTPYGQALSPSRLELTSLALSALQHMGFKATEAQRLVDAVLAKDAVPVDPRAFIRAALRVTR